MITQTKSELHSGRSEFFLRWHKNTFASLTMLQQLHGVDSWHSCRRQWPTCRTHTILFGYWWPGNPRNQDANCHGVLTLCTGNITASAVERSMEDETKHTGICLHNTDTIIAIPKWFDVAEVSRTRNGIISVLSAIIGASWKERSWKVVYVLTHWGWVTHICR